MSEGIGNRFQQETKYVIGRSFDAGLRRIARPDTQKKHLNLQLLKLPEPVAPADMTSLDQALRTRRSVRDYAASPITLNQLSYLLWASDGVSCKHFGQQFRTAPSAGATYPIETYLVANKVDGLNEGIYHYLATSHSLEELSSGSFGKAIAKAALDQEMCAEAAVVFVWTAVFERSLRRYGQRCYRYIYLDAGHIAENLALTAVAMSLGSCQIGAFYDDEVNKLLDVDGVEESVVYMSVVGHPM
jgi:SagB-type dehydrogenase family enzyme